MTDNKSNLTQLYRHYDENDALLYVGISLSTINRLSQHKQHSDWFSNIRKVTVEEYLTRQDAIDAETRAIQEEKPKHNIRKQYTPPKKQKNLLTDECEKILTNKIVNFYPFYTEEEAAKQLCISKPEIRRLIENKKLSAILKREKHFNTEKYGTVIHKQYVISGWQLMDFIETSHARGSFD